LEQIFFGRGIIVTHVGQLLFGIVELFGIGLAEQLA